MVQEDDEVQQAACQLEMSKITTIKKVISSHSSVPVALVHYATEVLPDFVCVGSRGLGALQRFVSPLSRHMQLLLL